MRESERELREGERDKERVGDRRGEVTTKEQEEEEEEELLA